MNKDFVIATSLIGPAVGISSATVREIVRTLEECGDIDVVRTPTGRERVNFLGYECIREAIAAKRDA